MTSHFSARGNPTLIRGEALAVPHSSGIAPPVMLAPSGAVDCHIHIFDRRFPRRVAMQNNAAEWGSVADYRLFQRRLGLSRVVVVSPSSYGFDNDCLIDALDAFGDCARGIAAIRHDTNEGELARLHDHGVRGIRLYAEKGRVQPEELAQYAERIMALNWHIQFVAGREAGALYRFEHALSKLSCSVVIDHMGYLPGPEPMRDPGYPVLRRLLDRGHVWVKLSAVYLRSAQRCPPYDDCDALAQALAQAAPERCLWGTDWPHTGVRDPDLKPDGAELFDRIARWVPAESARHRMLVANPDALYWS